MTAEVVPFPGDTVLDLPAEQILSTALAAGLKGVVVVGRRADGSLYLSSTTSDLPLVFWELEHAKRHVLELSDGD